MGRAILRGTAIVAALLIAVLAVGLLYRAWRQHEVAHDLAITAPNGIDEASFVRIGGIDQYIRIRGEDRANPVILFVHGGPGISMMGLTPVFRSWEKSFTVVQWDQRGAGKTYGRNGEAEATSMTIARMTEDGIEVADYLRRHLHKNRIIVLGHSWGTVLALGMVRQRPDLFAAYVGTGQLVNKQENEAVSFQMVLHQAEEAHDARAVEELKAAGPPPYKTFQDLLVERKWMQAFDIPSEKDLFSHFVPMVAFAPDYSLWDCYDQLASASFSQGVLYEPLNPFDARKLGLDFAVPFFVFEGESDDNTPAALSQRYLDEVRAPVKRFVLIPHAGHDAVLTDSGVFLDGLVRYVRPAAVAAGG
jgi:pimeloyl-ACP methyl ester carboxylesterase